MSKVLTLPVVDDKPTALVVPVAQVVTVPRDVYLTIEREAERDPSDPFLARRLAAHYKQGIWGPQNARK